MGYIFDIHDMNSVYLACQSRIATLPLPSTINHTAALPRPHITTIFKFIAILPFVKMPPVGKCSYYFPFLLHMLFVIFTVMLFLF